MKLLSRLLCPLIFVLWMAVPQQAHAQFGILDDCLLFPSIVPFPAPCPEPAPPAPVVTVKVGVPACVDADNNLEYRIIVENRAPADAHRVMVLDRLPANAKFVRSSPPPHRTEPELQWQLGTLKANACQEITLILAPTNAEDITNCIRVQFEHGVCVTTRQAGSAPRTKLPGGGPIPKEPPKKPTTEEPPLTESGKLTLSVKGPPRQSVKEPARYAITVVNVGNAAAVKVSIETELPDKLLLVNASDKGRLFEGKVAWSLGDIPANGSRSVELVVRAREPGAYCLKTRAEFGPTLTETFTPFEKTCTTFFLGVPAMLLELYDREDPIPVDGTTSYPIRITNQGSAPVTNIRIEATVPAGMELLPGSTRGPVKYRVEGKTLIFDPLAELEPGAKMEYEVFTRALAAGDMRFKIRLTADQLKEGGPVNEEESTTVYSEDVPPARVQAPPRSPRAIALRWR